MQCEQPSMQPQSYTNSLLFRRSPLLYWPSQAVPSSSPHPCPCSSLGPPLCHHDPAPSTSPVSCCPLPPSLPPADAGAQIQHPTVRCWGCGPLALNPPPDAATGRPENSNQVLVLKWRWSRGVQGAHPMERGCSCMQMHGRDLRESTQIQGKQGFC